MRWMTLLVASFGLMLGSVAFAGECCEPCCPTNPCITYRSVGERRSCLERQASFSTTLSVKNPQPVVSCACQFACLAAAPKNPASMPVVVCSIAAL